MNFVISITKRSTRLPSTGWDPAPPDWPTGTEVATRTVQSCPGTLNSRNWLQLSCYLRLLAPFPCSRDGSQQLLGIGQHFCAGGMSKSQSSARAGSCSPPDCSTPPMALGRARACSPWQSITPREWSKMKPRKHFEGQPPCLLSSRAGGCWGSAGRRYWQELCSTRSRARGLAAPEAEQSRGT